MNPWHLWSKTDRDNPNRWHSLPWHLVEVGSVAEYMWRYTVPEPKKIRLVIRMGLDDPKFLERWIGFIAATHDLGKISPKFQGLVNEQAQRLTYHGITTRKSSYPLRHGLITAAELAAILTMELGVEKLAAQRYAFLTGGHHGRFWSKSDLAKVSEQPGLAGQGAWCDARAEMVRFLADAFDIPTELPGNLTTTIVSYEDAADIAGLITAADWLGSDETHFTFRTDEMSPRESYKCAAKRAAKAMGQTGWFQQPVTIPSDSLKSAIKTLPPESEPYPAQLRAMEAIRSLKGPGIALVEYPMGEGKTEIAVWAAAHWAEHHGIPGFYVAMPTMATSDQLHHRVSKHLGLHATEHKGNVNLQLLHGQADLSAMPEIPDNYEGDDLESTGQKLARIHEPEQDNSDRIQRTRWFTRRKRGLLATYGVGTVDQILMSVLLTNHFFVRTHGMAGKTIIFDEVHGFDIYMSTLFDEVLRWLGALNSPVVILSATLPQHRTREMIAAYQEGAGWQYDIELLESYPRVSVVGEHGFLSVHAPASDDDAPRSIKLVRVSEEIDDDAIWSEVGPRLSDVLREGTAAIICNTVRQAQQAYRLLRQWFDKHELTLFHARFRQKERLEIQKNVLRRFGKESTLKNRKQRHVVIATQVIEQSLDLDFDLMISMFCPTDLLLQRLGRMQRHKSLNAIRPAYFRDHPELWIIGVQESASELAFSPGTSYVYDKHVLIRSWCTLRNRKQIVIPTDVESLVETTYGIDVVPPEDLLIQWNQTADEWKQRQDEDAKVAQSVRIAPLERGNNPREKDVFTQLFRVKDDQDDEPFLHASALAQTRLGQPGIPLVILEAHEADMYLSSFSPDENGLIPLEHVRPMLQRSVSVSLPNVVREAMEVEPPAVWTRTTHLRHHRLVILDDNNHGLIGKLAIEHHPQLGVRFGKDVEEDLEDE